MAARLIAPASYVQGRDVLTDGGTYAPLTGTEAFVLGGETAIGAVESALTTGLDAADIAVGDIEPGVDACTFAVIDRLVEAATGAEVIVAVGGGKALDTGKAVAQRIEAELVTVPTVASTDAPCSTVAVVYDEAGEFDGYVQRNTNPEVVAVDTEVIASAPVRFLRHGMGDALATRFEVEAATQAGAGTHAGEEVTRTARLLASECYTTIREDGKAAIAAVRRDAVTSSVAAVIEANTLLSGLGFESGGLAAAHAFAKGFSRAGVTAPHGVQIAFGTIAQLLLEDRDRETRSEVIELCRELDLAVSLTEMGAADAVETIAREACTEDTTMTNQPQSVTPAMAADALRTADELLTE
ncbi:MAG: glycerol dehydrogenase [Halobacteriales archaeon]